MQESQQTLLADEETTLVAVNIEATGPAADEDATLVAPRFDDEETVLARPVVPLEEADAHATSAFASLPSYSLMPSAPRRTWLLALVLISVLGGGLLGGAALYLYQNRAQADDASTGTTRQPETPSTSSQPATTTQAVSVPTNAPAPQTQEPASNASANKETDAQHSDASNSDASNSDASNSDQRDAGTANASGAENVPAAERRREPDSVRDEAERTGTPKRGKKGEHDEDSVRPRRPSHDSGEGRQLSRAADEDNAAPTRREARRIDTIFYRPRRVARRHEGTRRETAGDADRLRRIFEGQP